MTIILFYIKALKLAFKIIWENYFVHIYNGCSLITLKFKTVYYYSLGLSETKVKIGISKL